jgi:Glycosyltransferase family 87
MALHHLTGAERRATRNVERGTDVAQRATLVGVLALLSLLSVGRLLLTAFSYGIPAWFDEELNPLIGLVIHGQPITTIDARQYGVMVFLVFDPAVRIASHWDCWQAVGSLSAGVGQCYAAIVTPSSVAPNLAGVAAYATWVSLVAAVIAFAFVAGRYAVEDQPSGSSISVTRVLLLALVWSSAVPLLYVLAQHMVDAWQLCFLALSLFLFTGSARQRRYAALPLAAATLTKLLPALLLVYVFVRSWRAGLVGVAGIGVLLAVGQLAYGWLIGFGYPLAMLAGGGDTVARWSTHFENNSVRGLLFKIGAGFRLQGDTTNYILDPRVLPVLNVLAYGLAAALVAYLLLVAWRGRGHDSIERRSIEFSLAIVTMLLVSPHTAQDYLVTMLPVLAVWLFLWTRGLPRAWSFGQTSLACLATLLIAVIVPMNLFIRVLPITWLLTITQNAHNMLFADQIGSGIGVYEFFGFPGLGLLLGWVLLVRLERQSRAR